MKTRKYNYYKVIQGNYGQGWEDLDFHECDSKGVLKNKKELMNNLHAYKEAD